MSGVAIVRQLLIDSAAVAALVPAASIHAGVVPQGATLPAIGVSEVGSNEQATTARNLPARMVRERVQVTVLAKGPNGYSAMKALLKAAALGRGVHTGVVKGIQVRSVLPEGVNPEIPPADDGIYEQSRDFMVTFVEAQ